MEYGDKRRVNVRGIIYKDGKLFCQQLNDDLGKPHNFWSVPGGGLNAKEPLVNAVEREIMEETGVKADAATKNNSSSFSILKTHMTLRILTNKPHILRLKLPIMDLSTRKPPTCCQCFCRHLTLMTTPPMINRYIFTPNLHSQTLLLVSARL